MARGPRYVDFGAIHRDRERRRDAKASGHLGNVGQDEFTADGLVKAAPPPKRHTTSTFDNGMEAFQAVSTAQRKSDARKTSLSDLAIGGGEALSQLQLGDRRLLTEAGSVGFLLWRSVYIVKQVSLRTRILVLFDVLKTTLFGRDVTRL